MGFGALGSIVLFGVLAWLSRTIVVSAFPAFLEQETIPCSRCVTVPLPDSEIRVSASTPARNEAQVESTSDTYSIIPSN